MKTNFIERIDETNYQQYLDDGVLVITDTLVEEIDFIGYNFSEKVVIRNCLIRNLHITGCWFEGGLIFEQCVVTDFTEHEMGGHNEEEIHIRYNVFCCFFDCFDCQFHAKVFVHNNIFIKGTSLKGNAGKPFENSFDNGLEEYDNIGKLDLD